MSLLKSKRVWAAALTLLGTVLAHYTGNEDLVEPLVAAGMALVVATKLADERKANEASE